MLYVTNNTVFNFNINIVLDRLYITIEVGRTTTARYFYGKNNACF